VNPQPGSVISLGADIWDSDGILPDSHLGNEKVDALFETGWRKEITVRLTGDGTKVNVTFELQPI
jgi:hypothetical protein